MRILLQRVRSAQVSVIDDNPTAQGDPSSQAEQTPATTGTEPQEIASGLLLLVGVEDSDGEAEIAWMAHKIANLRIFEDSQGKMNRSVLQEQGSVLSVSQFTLYADTKKGNRPSFTRAGRPEHAKLIWERFNAHLEEIGVPVHTGVFGAHMLVELQNDGPVTILLDSQHST
ncbi:MAG: D-aminoacyl-tRNA deacylase [Bifidobacterium sp.]|jgi:D-tyrosyl-tRNA(Tyr) deacylase|nr:D-aminoacyl-tRNA deacylase [Bifidobacterium sp.]MCH4174699.1 D-aminoacyl-tRNA deacylase [Bifidobacterium sp.]